MEDLAKFNLIGAYPSTVKFFRQEPSDGLSGETKTVCVHIAFNMRGCVSLTSKLPQRMLNWDGNRITLPFAVPKNISFQSDIKAIAYENGLGIGDRKIRYPGDKYDEESEIYFLRPKMDDSELNNEILDLAVYVDLANNAHRTVIC